MLDNTFVIVHINNTSKNRMILGTDTVILDNELFVVTNNPMVWEILSSRCEVRYFDVPLEDVLRCVRDLVHKGHKLLTHPLSGSVKPKETMYKSIALSKDIGPLDEEGVSLIENCVGICESFEDKRKKSLDLKTQKDFQLIDLSLISSIF